MSCERCTKVPTLNFNVQKIYIFSEIQDLVEKISSILEKNNYKYKSFNSGVELTTTSFETLLIDLKNHENLIEMEHSDIQILPLESSELTPCSLRDIKTLKMWLNIAESKELIDMLEHNSFTTHFQPIVNANRREVYGHEALLRGVKENGGIVSPFQLFKMAKDSNLLFNLDRQAREINIANSYKHKLNSKIFINFTPTAIYDPEFCLRSTMEKIREFDIKPEQIVFEVVESEEVSEISHLKRILDYYRSEGFKVALDDLGSGYSSLNKLFNLRPDYVKIDMDIVRGIEKDKVKQSILKTIINISKESGIMTIAEGVETKEELDFVVDSGADLIQGYFYSKPLKKPFKFNE